MSDKKRNIKMSKMTIDRLVCKVYIIDKIKDEF